MFPPPPQTHQPILYTVRAVGWWWHPFSCSHTVLTNRWMTFDSDLLSDQMIFYVNIDLFSSSFFISVLLRDSLGTESKTSWGNWFFSRNGICLLSVPRTIWLLWYVQISWLLAWGIAWLPLQFGGRAVLRQSQGHWRTKLKKGTRDFVVRFTGINVCHSKCYFLTTVSLLDTCFSSYFL